MKTIYLINFIGDINSAYMNRTLAIAKGLGESGVSVKIIFLPSSNLNTINLKYKNVECIYLWESCKIKKHYHILLLYSLCKLFYLLKDDIPIVFIGVSQYLFLFRLKKGLTMYHETTEHPDFYTFTNKRFGNVIMKLYFKTCRKLDGLFVISPSLKKYFETEIGVPSHKIHIINMIVDSYRFDNVYHNENSKYISYCGTVSEYKDGVDVLIRSFSLIHKKYPDLILQIIGPMQNQIIKKRLLSIVEELNLNQSVCFRGAISSLDMPQILADSKLLVLSRPNNKQARYGFPTKLGEYLMTGIPVVVTDVGDLNLYLKDLQDVIFAKPNSVESFSDRIDWVLENYKFALKIGFRGRQVALKEFNYLIEAQKMLDVIFE